MFRKMCRFKQEMPAVECRELLKTQVRGVLSLLGDDGYPYGLPIDYWYNEADGKLYFHGAKEGHKIDAIRACQPDAVIYLQAIMKVTTERSGQGDYITNEGIEARNEEIAKLADDEKIYYLDVNPLICDETGGMVASYTYDGVHLKAQYIPIWLDFLKEHAVE